MIKTMSKKAVTLVEMLVSISLLSVIIMAATSFDFASRKFVNSSQRKSLAVNEASLILEHIQKYASFVHGFDGAGAVILNRGWTTASGVNNVIMLRIDDPANPSPENLNDDLWVRYYLDASNTFRFCPDTAVPPITVPGNCNVQEEILSSRVTLFGWSATGWNLGTPTITLTARYNASATVNNSTNPNATVSGELFFGSLSL